jgi:hypothetical protein
MRWTALLILALTACPSSAADRNWETGKWADAGISRNPFVGDPRSGSPAALPIPHGRATPEVGRYIIETTDMRYTVEDIVPLGGPSSLDLVAKIGDRVTFAVSKNTVYIKGDGTEYRLRLVKKEARHASGAELPAR